ncbi:MAG: glycosyltransferase family 2 protein [Proteobacteria bacterium]|nr:glycosyltransferase family 2 protein [Pseudomonadota bacterium]
MSSPSIAVIIAAFNSASTIDRAVRSALAEDEVRECIVVDDASGDATVASALRADDGTKRLKVIRLSENRGPAYARNAALDVCTSDYVCVLDADDYFIPGRLRRLLERVTDDDLLADDIIIVPEQQLNAFTSAQNGKIGGDMPPNAGIKLQLADFIRSNIPRRGRPRAETGFLKPIMKRDFIERTRLRYDPALRLGEDYAYYARALMAGAKFRIVGACGYIAVERSNSLSSRHSIADLSELANFDSACISNGNLNDDQRAAFREHLRATNNNIAFRRALSARSEDGLLAGIATAAQHPSSLGYMVSEALYARYRKTRVGMENKDDHAKPDSIRLLIGEAGLR